MKKNTYIILASAAALAMSMVLPGRETTDQKLAKSKENVTEAQVDLKEANEDYLKDVEIYKAETAKRISDNEKSIYEFREKLKKDKKQASIEYKKKVAALEEKNTTLRVKLENYKQNGKEGWDAFKSEFSHDMDELGTAFQGLTQDEVK